MSENNSGCTVNCGGCLTTILVGTAIVGTIALGGIKQTARKIESTWNYDKKLEFVTRAHDVNLNGELEEDEQREMYRSLGLTTIEGEFPKTKIPYNNLVEFSNKYGQK